MTLPTTLAQRPQSGRLVRARDMRRMYDAVEQLSIINSATSQEDDEDWPSIQYLGVYEFSPTPGDGILRCIRFDDTRPSPQIFLVLAPPTFYETDRDGVTYAYSAFGQRVATEGSDNESQYLQPSMNIGDAILCVRIRGAWLDLNIDARQWVADPA